MAAREPDNQLQSDYAGLALVFAELTRRKSSWRQALEDWNVLRSRQVLEWQSQIRQEDLVRALELRFGSPIPEDLARAIKRLKDLEELSRWFDASQTVGSLDEFRAGVGADHGVRARRPTNRRRSPRSQ